MLKVSVLIAVCCLLTDAALAASIDCSSIDECRKPMKIYEELGCKPIYGSKSCCPKRYECSDDLKVIKDDDKCTFKGVAYNVGDLLPRSLTNESKCLEACVCSRFEDEPAQFSCTNSDCGISSSLKVPGCANIYGDLNECCSTSVICDDDDEKEKLATCWDGDEEYREGEKFRSKSNPCYECLCHKDYDNTTIIEENSHCHKLNCEIELKYKSFIQRGCLPIFENDKCCPVDWKCFDSPKKGKKIVKRSSDDDETSTEESAITTELPNVESSTEQESIKVTQTEDSTQASAEIEVTKSDVPKPSTRLTPPVEVETTTMSLDEEKLMESTTEAIQETTLSLLTEDITTTTAAEVNEKSTTEMTTESTTISESTTTSTENSATESSTKARKLDSTEEENDSSEEDTDNKNIFDEEIAKSSESEEDNKTEQAPTTTESSTSEASTTSVSETSTTSAIERETQAVTEEIEEEATTSIPEITTTESSTEASTTEATVTIKKLSPPVPTMVENLFTTLKDLKTYVSNLNLTETKASEEALPAAFVNFTISRSIPAVVNVVEKESKDEETPEAVEQEESKIQKRSVDSKFYQLKYSNKEKGCVVGAEFYKVGEEIVTSDKCLECFCYYSPIGHCVRKENCAS